MNELQETRIMGNNAPWLESLSDDWVPVPGTPSPVPARSINHSRRSSLQQQHQQQQIQSSPSRIPVPARRSVDLSPVDEKKKITRPCHFVRREPPTPKGPRTPRTPSKLRSPVPDKTKKTSPNHTNSPRPAKSPRSSTVSPKSTTKTTTRKTPSKPNATAAARKQQPPSAVDTRSPLRSVSNMSSQSSQNTVQVRPKKSKDRESTTPEWRKRLVQGEIPSGDQRDLFAPIGLESVFKPPTPGTEATRHDQIPMMKQSDHIWNFNDEDREEDRDPNWNDSVMDHDSEGRRKDAGDAKGKEPVLQETKPEPENKDNTDASPPGSPADALKVKKGAEGSRAELGRNHEDPSYNNTQLRTASGLEDLRNEGITPITFSRTNTVDGNGTSEVIQSALKQVTNKLESLSLPDDHRPGSRASDSALLCPQSDPQGQTVLPEDDLLDVTSNSLPQDLSMGTLDYRGRGGFAKFRRTEYLGDGSFLKPRLTPSSFPSQRLSPNTLGNSRIRSSPPYYLKNNPLTDPPTLPRPSSAHIRNSASRRSGKGKDESMPSSGSPLKLFGDHDTFTNNRLLRRMSQFEETFGQNSDDDEPVSPSEEARRKGESRSLLNVKPDMSSRHSSRRSRARKSFNPKLNRFGDGGLDKFDFSDTSPYEPKLLYNEIPDPSYRPSSRRRSSIPRRHFRRTSLEDIDQESMTDDGNFQDHQGSPSHNKDEEAGEGDSLGYDEVKRASNMPSRETHPKRRRTILRSDSPDVTNEGIDNLEQPDNLSLLQRSLIKHGIEDADGKHPDPSQPTNGPISPEPSPTKSSMRKRSSSEWDQSQPIPNSHLGEDSPPGPAEMEVPKVKVTGVNNEMRKGSITTQDYLDEATRVMDMIRSKGRSAGGLPSLEEIDMEDEEAAVEDEDEDDESTREEFSRPPSRDGVDLRKLREPNKEPNPRILSHLKKFQENDDPEFLHLDEDQQPDTAPRDNEKPEDESDRGLENSQDTFDDYQKRKNSVVSDEDDDQLQDLLTYNTQVSSKSINTGSTTGSHAKGVLSSDLVSHLIPEQVNGFTYDRFKHLWVKEGAEKSPEKPKGEDSEDDPFRDIPDLSVDELQEMMRIEAADSPRRTEDGSSAHDVHDPKSPLSAKIRNLPPRPHTKDGAPSVNTSTLQSKGTRFTSSVPNSGTRATSWDTNEQKNREASSEVEHEIKLHEGRLSKPPQRQQDLQQQARVVTISFSSPLVSHVAYSDNDTPTKYTRNGGKEIDQAPQTEGEGSTEQAGKPTAPGTSDGQPSTQQPISKIDEGDEDANGDLSVVRQEDPEAALSTPLKGHPENSLMVLRDDEKDNSYSFNLSPLPDFTVDQIDHPLQLELSYVAQRTHPTSLRQVHGTFALATEDLVKHLTEVEPFEPYWEHVRRLILREKGLITLHKLSDFCPRLEDLDVSDNDIGQLSGIPASLRTLKIQRNYLSGLTAWGHLTNLQYLDVSGNDLESLDGFGSLIHLREIKANDNNIRNIDGVLDLNGLLSLKLSNNSLVAVDFEGAELTRLNDLDLSHNELTSVRNLSALPSLSSVNLSFNQLASVDFPEPLFNLRSLKLSNNHLHSVDVAALPSLALLYLDQNSLSTVSGIDQCHNLDVLSAREQIGSVEHFDIDLGLVKDIRKVFLSSNKLSLGSVSPSAPLLRLQLLDIASCKLESLPEEFALNFPNVKVLNLNFNALTGVTELAAMKCLSRLTVAGNRITRMRKLCQALSRIGRTSRNSTCSLHKVDLRGNPLTVRFYAPAVTGSGKDENKKLQAKEAASRDHRDHARGNGNKVGLDLTTALADIRHSENIAHPALWGEDGELPDQDRERDIEINDPYTLPPGDSQADTKYFSHLDESTRLRRRILELMIYAGTGGSVKCLDGLVLQPRLEEGSDMDHAWTKLEKLGVLRRKAITAS